MHRSSPRRLVPTAAWVLAIAGVLAAPVAAMSAALAPVGAAAVRPVETVGPEALQLKLILSGLSSPTSIAHAGDGSGRLFITQRGGQIRIVTNNSLQAASFMNISTKIVAGGERGLLGLAFHPSFETNRRFYVFYTRASDGDLIIASYLANSALTSGDPDSEQILLRIEHSSETNHNGGHIAFGPNGYLHIAVGDGGGGGDPDDNGQDKDTLLGTLLRIDVDGTGAGPFGRYAIPPGNPFAGPTAGADEIWAWGLRNPWKFSFDRANGNLWIADVGQSQWEEINRETANDPGGRNYGWNVMEGAHCYAATSCNTSGKTLPIAEYAHNLGCSVTGGHVYRGTTQRGLIGQYVLADYCTARIWTIPANGTSLSLRRDLDLNISSFGASEGGELYAVDLGGGRLYRIVAPEFSDILASPFLDEIHWIVYQAITAGCGGDRFCPGAAVTRGQIASFLVRALSLPPTTNDFFTDDETSIHEGDINRLAAAGLTSGCAPNRYCPTVAMTRAEMASFLARALGLPATSIDSFTDDETSIHEADINRVAAAGITTGCAPALYCPNQSVTREQMAAFLERTFD